MTSSSSYHHRLIIWSIKVATCSVCVEFTDFIFTEHAIVLATVEKEGSDQFSLLLKTPPSLSHRFFYTCYRNRQGNPCIAPAFKLFYPILLFLD